MIPPHIVSDSYLFPMIVPSTITSFKFLLEAELLEEEATCEAVELLVSAALIEKMAID